MRQRYLILGVVILLTACAQKRKSLAEAVNAPEIRQEKELNSTKFVLTYMPACWQRNIAHGNADSTDMVFRLQVHPDKKSISHTDDNAASFGTDTLFALVAGGDTLSPVYSHRVANGNLTGVEYIIAFNRENTGNTGGLRFIYKDWLFTSARMEFFFERANIKKVDDLSCSL